MAPSRAIVAFPLRRTGGFVHNARPVLHLAQAPSARRTIYSQQRPITQSLQTHRPSYESLQLSQTRCFPAFSPCRRSYSTAAPEPPDHLDEQELHVFNKIRDALEPVKLEVQDISGGCGSMYAVEIASAKFNGLSVIKQHKMVNSVLKDEIAKWHGIQLKTKAV